MSESIATTENSTIQQVCGRLSRQLAQIGLSLTVHDNSGNALFSGIADNEVCTRLCQAGGACSDERQQLVDEMWADGQPRIKITSTGCVLLGMPMAQRRRTVAMALACYQTPETGGSEEFARSCDRMHLDREYLASVIDNGITHPAGESQHLLKSVQWLLTQENENVVAVNELATLSNNLGATYEELSLLYRLSSEMRISARPTEFFENACKDVLDVMNIAASVAVIHNRINAEGDDQIVRQGDLPLSDDQLRLLIARQVVPRFGPSAKAFVDNSPAVRDTGGLIRNFVAVPLTAGDQRRGVLLAINKNSDDFDSIDLKLLNSVGNQTAVFLANHHLYEDLQELLMGVLHVLTASIDAKDKYTCGHSQRVAIISKKLAELAGFDPPGIQRLYMAGLLHDIGKIGVPESVLCKAGKLTDEEFAAIKLHPVIGDKILSKIRQMQDIIPGVLHHHERIDGRGYPDNLAGNNVPMQGRIVGLADCFDAMTSSRTYRRALPIEAVVAEIMRCSGTQFDPFLVDCLLSLDLPAFLEQLHRGDGAMMEIGNALMSGAA